MQKSTNVCEHKDTFECQKYILENIVDKIEKSDNQITAQSKKVKQIIKTVETFLKENKLLCYGGTAINNILPNSVQFYDRKKEIPDYDFFSPDAINDAKRLANIYYKQGYQNVTAKSGLHHGTYKVFVNFIPVADITYMHLAFFKKLYKGAIVIRGIHYAPPNFLRMAMYLELSRPKGMVSRWPKVFERLHLLNKYYPIMMNKNRTSSSLFDVIKENKSDSKVSISDVLLDIFIDEKVVFFGGMAELMYMKKEGKAFTNDTPIYDVLSVTPQKTVYKIKNILESKGYGNVNVIKHEKESEYIPTHYEIHMQKQDRSVAYIFSTSACYSYNSIPFNDSKMRIATINTILSFYLSFIYSSDPHFDEKRLICMAQTLFDLQNEKLTQNNGIFRQYSMNCYGKQQQLLDIMIEKDNKFKQLRNNKSSPEFDSWFLNYQPSNA